MAFLDIVDRSGRMQVQARADVLGEEAMAQLVEFDLGDIVGIDGSIFASRSLVSFNSFSTSSSRASAVPASGGRLSRTSTAPATPITNPVIR